MTTIIHFLVRIDAAQAVLGHTDSYLSRLIFDDGKVIGRLRTGSGSVTIARLERAEHALSKLMQSRSDSADLSTLAPA